MQEGLSPCPFCGGEVFVAEDDSGMSRWVECDSCEANGPPIAYKFKGTKEEARKIVVERWNNRSNHHAMS